MYFLLLIITFPLYSLFFAFKKCLSFIKCVLSDSFNVTDNVLLLLYTQPSAYKKPNQYAFSSVLILSNTVLSNFN